MTRLAVVVGETPLVDDETRLAPSGLPAPHGIGAWGGRRLIYRGDDDLEPLNNCDLHVVLLDVLLKTARIDADRTGRALDRSLTVERAAKTRKMAAEKRAVVASCVAAVTSTLKAMAASPVPVEIGFQEVADRMADDGRGVHRGTLYRRPEYRIPILKAMGRDVLDEAELLAAADPEYARVARLTKAELIEEIRRARTGFKKAEREFAASLSAGRVTDRFASSTSHFADPSRDRSPVQNDLVRLFVPV